MRFFEFKQFLEKNRLTEDYSVSLPSKKMTSAEMFKDNGKYITYISKSVESGKTFMFAAGPKTVSGVVDAILVDGKSMDADSWGEWATNPDVNQKDVMNSIFVVGDAEFKAPQMYKSEAVTGLKINKGDLAEAILGAAITAKFARGGGKVSDSDLIYYMKEVVNNQRVTVETNYQISDIKEDNVEFILTLNAAAMSGIKAWLDEKDPLASDVSAFDIVKNRGVEADKIKSIQKLVKDGTSYANSSKQVEVAVNKAKADPNRNLVEIISDGGDASQQSITKVDLKIMFDGEPVRLLSLKSGTVGQFGQESGGTWEAAKRFVDTTLKIDLPSNLKDEWGFKEKTGSDTSYLKHNYAGGPFSKLYDYMETTIKGYTDGDDTRKEYNLVKIAYDAINYHATKGEAGVTMVILSPSAKIAYKELAFDARLLSALELYDLQVVNQAGNKNHQLIVYGTLIGSAAKKELGSNATKLSSKAKLFQLRSAVQGNAIRNIIEMGDLLKDLADVEKLSKQTSRDNSADNDLSQQPKEPAQQLKRPAAKPQANATIPKDADRSF
jgi:hypothetical protein